MSEKKNIELLFCCPKCQCTYLKEVQVDCTVMTTVRGVRTDPEGRPILDYGKLDIEDGGLDSYQCAYCGFEVPGSYPDCSADTEGELRDFLLTLPCNADHPDANRKTS
jgi:hypothetical protein